MFSWLKRLATGARDLVDANTAEDQRKRLAVGQPRFYQQQKQQATQAPQRSQFSNGQVRAAQMGIKAPSYGNGLGALWNATKDTLWDANTAQDIFKRNVAALNEVRGPMKIPKLNETYIEQQDRLGNKFVGNNFKDQAFQSLAGGTSAIVKTGKDVSEALQRMNQAAGAKQREGTLGWRDRVGVATANVLGAVNPVNAARMPYDQLKGYLDSQGSEAIAQQASQELNKDLDSKGPMNVQSMVNSKEAKNLTPSKIAKTATAYGIKSGTEVLPLGKGYQAATNVVKGGAILKPFLANAVGDLTLGSAGSAVDQYIQTGKIDPMTTLKGGLLSTAMGAGGFGLGMAKPKSGAAHTRLLADSPAYRELSRQADVKKSVISHQVNNGWDKGAIKQSVNELKDIEAQMAQVQNSTPKKPLLKPMNETGGGNVPIFDKLDEKINGKAPDPLDSLKQEATPPANAFQDTLPSGNRPQSIKDVVSKGGNPLYHDTNANGVLGILDTGEIKTSQAPFSSIAGQGKRVSTTRNFDNYSRYGKSPYRFVIDETRTGQRAIPDNREEFESIFNKPVKANAIESLAIDTTNPEIIRDIDSGRLQEVIDKAREKGIKIEPFEGKILPDEYANKEVQQLTKDKFNNFYTQPPKPTLKTVEPKPKVSKTLIPKDSLAPNGRVKTAEVDRVFNSLPDGSVGNYGFVKKNGKIYPPKNVTPEQLKRSFIDLNPDGSVVEGFGITKMSFLDGVKDSTPTPPKPKVTAKQTLPTQPKPGDALYITPQERASLKPKEPVFNAPNTPGLIRKPTAKSNAPQGAGVIPLDKLGKETVTEAPQRLITGKARKDAVVQNVLESVSKQRGKSGVEGSLVAGSISRKAKELGIKLDRTFIDKYQTGKLDTPAERQMAAHIKSETDPLFLKQQALDPTIQYRQNYVPQSYDNTADEVAAAVNKLEKSTGASKRRVFSTYAEAEKFGLKPKNITLDQMIGESAAKAEKVAQNVNIVNKGLAGGIFTTDTKGVPLAGIISPDGKQLYATKQVADIVNGVLQKDSQGLAAGIGKVARAFETSLDIMLQGGIPGTNANFFVAGQAIKDTTRNIGKSILHPVQAVKQEGNLIGDLFRGKSGTQKRFTQGTFKANGQTIKNTDFVRAMADRGLYIQPQTGMADLGNSGLRTSWNTLGNKPTFGRYMPNRMLSTAQEVYSQSVKKVGHQQALKLAADTVKTFNGHVDTILKARTNLTNDMMGVALFAPKYRESIINALGNVVKSVYPTKWADKSYAPSRQLLAGMAVTLGAYEMLNRQLSGHSMMENRTGQELSVEIPYGEKDDKGNQKVINIPFMPGFMTIPRAIGGAISNTVQGNVKGVLGEVSKALSSPLQTGGRVLANQDYFGRPIYNDEKTAAEQGVEKDNPLQAFAKIGGYVAGQNSPSWVRAAIDKVSGKPTEQAIATALEAPVRFGKKLNPATEAYFNDIKDVRGGLNKNDQAVWDTLYPPIKKNVNGEYITDKTVWGGAARAANLLNNPDVLAAATEMAQRAKERGEKVDPLFGQLKGEQQLIALTLDTLPPKDPQKTALKNQNPWYDEYYKTRQAFFDGLPPGDPNKPKAPIAYPEPSQQLETIQKAYYQLEDSTMKRKMLEDNPELVDQMAKEEQYSRAVRAAKNLPQYDKYPEAPKDVQNLIDFYSALPKGEANGKSKVRSAWIKSHPNEWAKMTDQFSRQAQYNLQRDASLAAFEGEDLTERGIKSITSLAKSLGMEDGGSGGYSSGGRYARGGGGGGRSSKPQIPDYSSIISSVSGLQKKVTGAKVKKVSLKNKVKKPSTRRT